MQNTKPTKIHTITRKHTAAKSKYYNCGASNLVKLKKSRDTPAVTRESTKSLTK